MTRLKVLCISLIVISLVFVGQSFAKIAPKNIMGVWLFNEGKGDEAKDSSKNSNDGVFVGEPEWVVGKEGKALEFDGTDDYLDCGNDESLQITDGTVAAWFKASDNMSTYRVIVSDEHDPGTGTIVWSYRIIMTQGTGVLYTDFTINNRASSSNVSTNVATNDNSWHHVAIVRDDGAKSFKIYLDGIEKNSTTYAGTIDNSTNRTFIGASGSWGGADFHYPFDGIIDDVGIFNVPLTEDEINSIMNNGLSGIAAMSPKGKLATTWADIK